jgi:hypothetical protein
MPSAGNMTPAEFDEFCALHAMLCPHIEAAGLTGAALDHALHGAAAGLLNHLRDQRRRREEVEARRTGMHVVEP